jgi:hypothetical protein
MAKKYKKAKFTVQSVKDWFKETGTLASDYERFFQRNGRHSCRDYGNRSVVPVPELEREIFV